MSRKGESASKQITSRIAELGDWRSKTLSRMRKLVKAADPDVAEEWKWMGTTPPFLWDTYPPLHDLFITAVATSDTGSPVPVSVRHDDPKTAPTVPLP